MRTTPFRTSRSFLLVSQDAGLTQRVRRALVPYRRTFVARDHAETRMLLEREAAPVGLLVQRRLDGCDGMDVLRATRELHPFVPAVLFDDAPSSEQLARGYSLRASHLPSLATGDELRPFIFRALTEEHVPDERVGCLVESLVRGSVLTDREAELLVLVIGDVPRDEIVDRMGISRNTLKGHVRALLAKLEVGDLDKLAARIFRIAIHSGGRVTPVPPVSKSRPPGVSLVRSVAARVSSIPPAAGG